jgi:hypothetical protein
MFLYLLVFKDEPLVKVGVTMQEGAHRWLQLGSVERFDFSRSFVVCAKDPAVIRLLEHNLKVLFAKYRRDAQVPLSSGNTEVFCGSALPKMLQLIEDFQRSWSEAGLCVQQRIASPISREPSLKPAHSLTQQWMEPHKTERPNLHQLSPR